MSQSGNKCELRQIGTSDIRVTPVAFGSWPIAGMTSLNVDDTNSIATVRAAVDSGINFIDAAYCYGANGESEKLIGRAIRDLSRESLVIASKGGIHWDSPTERKYDGSPGMIILECEESMHRMGITEIDLYYLHAPDPAVPVGDSATAFAKLLEQGKIRSAGVSNLTIEQMDEFQSVCPVSAVQPPYNMLQRDIEEDIIPWCNKRNVSVVTYWPLMKGVLAGKMRRDFKFDPEDKRLTYGVYQGDNWNRTQDFLDRLETIAADESMTIAQLVICWTIAQSGITSVLSGAKRDWQIRETAASLALTISDVGMVRIDDAIAERGSLV